MNLKAWVAGIVLFALPAGVAQWVKTSTDWGAVTATPKARQKGSAEARVTIVEYSDFQCPSCAGIQPIVKKLTEETYPGKVRLVYKYYPLTKIHKNAMQAATAAECAAAQDKFWPYQDKLFENQMKWAPLADATTSFMAYAGEVTLDTSKFTACMANPDTLKPIEADIAEAQRRQVQSTPTFFVGETRLVGSYLATDGARTIEKELRK